VTTHELTVNDDSARRVRFSERVPGAARVLAGVLERTRTDLQRTDADHVRHRVARIRRDVALVLVPRDLRPTTFLTVY